MILTFFDPPTHHIIRRHHLATPTHPPCHQTSSFGQPTHPPLWWRNTWMPPYLVYDITLCECFCLLLSNKKSRWFFCSVTSNQTYPLVSSHNQRRRRLCKFVWDKLFKRKLLKVCRYSVSKNVLIFHCLNKLFWLSQKFWKLSAFSFHIFKVFLYHHNIFFTVVQNNFWNKIPLVYITGRLPSISKSCSVELALAITLWLVEFLRHQATANWLNVHPITNSSYVFTNTESTRPDFSREIWCLFWSVRNGFSFKVKKVLKGSLDSISSPSVKIQIMGRKVCLRH